MILFWFTYSIIRTCSLNVGIVKHDQMNSFKYNNEDIKITIQFCGLEFYSQLRKSYKNVDTFNFKTKYSKVSISLIKQFNLK